MSYFVGSCALGRRVGGLLVAGAVALAVAVSGCGSSSTTTKGNGGSPSTTTAAADPAAASTAAIKKYSQPVTSFPPVAPLRTVAKLRGKTIWYIPIGEAIPNAAAQGVAMKAALSHLGINTHTCDGGLLPTTISSCLNQAVQQGAAAVVTTYIDYKMVPAAMDNVTSHHIPLLVAGEADDAGPNASKLLGFYNTNPIEATLAKLAGDQAISDTNAAGHIIYIGASDSPSLVTLDHEAVSDLKSACPKCTVDALSFQSAETQKVPAQISAALIQNPNTNYIVVGADPALPQVIQGVQSAGYTSKLKISALGGSLPALQTMKSGNLVTADAGVSNAYFAWAFADGILRMMLGGQPASYVGGIRLFNKQNVAGLTLTPAAFAAGSWYGSNAYQTAFLKAWAGK